MAYILTRDYIIMIKHFSLLALLCIITLSTSIAQSTDSLLATAIELREDFKEDAALKVFESIYAQDSTNYETIWSISILYARIGYRQKSEKSKETYYRTAKSYAEKALAINSNDYNSNYAMGVAMGRIALISGARERVAASKEIKMYADKCVELAPEKAGGWHMLGRWNHKIANLNFAERAAASILFGGAPKGASNEAAISSMQKAVDIEPNFILYKRDFANILEDLDKEKAALAMAKQVLEMPERSLDDPRYKEEMKKLIKDLD